MNKIECRKEAVRRRHMGESVASICRELNVSRKWFYKWYNRYQSNDSNWHQDQSKAPKHRPHKIDNEVERLDSRFGSSSKKQNMLKLAQQLLPGKFKSWAARRRQFGRSTEF